MSAQAAAADLPHEPFGPWKSELERAHPLVGAIVDAKTLRPMSRGELEKRMRAASVVLLGEIHDNPDHHRIQAALLRAFAKGRRPAPAVLFEMIETDRRKALDALAGKKGLTADEVFDAVRWEKSGWPPRKLYMPLMRAVVALGRLPRPAGLPAEEVRAISRKGLSSLPEKMRRAMRLSPLPERLRRELEREIVKSHCDMIPLSAARAMSGVQRMRDALMARELLAGYRARGSAVLIAGGGHVRHDRAVPLYLARMGGAPRPFVVWMAEARKEARDIAGLLPENTRPADLADVIIVTPRARRKDPCEEFRRFMEKKRKKRNDAKPPAPAAPRPPGGEEDGPVRI